jgi:hypothetical protein
MFGAVVAVFGWQGTPFLILVFALCGIVLALAAEAAAAKSLSDSA